MIKILKDNIAWIITHFPALIMSAALIIDPSNWKPITTYSGYSAVGFLILILALNPIKAFWKADIILKLNRYRQEIGVAVFSYSLIHLICFAIKRGSFAKMFLFLLHPGLLPVFVVGFPIFMILAITSNRVSKMRMGFVAWKKLHQKVYWAEIAVIIHMIILESEFWAYVLFGPLIALQLARKFFAEK